MGGQSSTVTGTDGPHANFECSYCHRVEAGASSGDNAFARVTYETDVAGVNNRYIAISVRDMEEMNYPDTLVVNATTVSGLKDSYRPGYSVSPVQTGFELNDTVVLTLSGSAGGVRLIATYDATTGEPIDTNPATRYNGLMLSRIASWDPGSRGSLTPNMTGIGSEAVNPGSAYHAASLVSCMECHGGADHGPLGHYSRIVDGENPAGTPCSDCHYGPVDSHTYDWRELDAGGFGVTVDNPDDTGISEAHMAYVKADDGFTRYGGSSLTNETALYVSNGACVACHTHVQVDITYNKANTTKFVADMLGAEPVLSDFDTTGSNISNSAGT
ncbi:MAG: hypothetical protein P1P72_05250 [ANME-2 cluster archaeon]|nr:hypothetical protein [ANME-2 cluster archaeon]